MFLWFTNKRKGGIQDSVSEQITFSQRSSIFTKSVQSKASGGNSLSLIQTSHLSIHCTSLYHSHWLHNSYYYLTIFLNLSIFSIPSSFELSIFLQTTHQKDKSMRRITSVTVFATLSVLCYQQPESRRNLQLQV